MYCSCSCKNRVPIIDLTLLLVVANDHTFGHDRKTGGDDKSNDHITGAEQYDEDFTLTILTLTLATGCLAREALVTVAGKGKQKRAATEANKLYRVAMTAVQREFGGSHAFRPWVKLVLGAEKNRADVDTGEIQFIRWDRGLFCRRGNVLGV